MPTIPYAISKVGLLAKEIAPVQRMTGKSLIECYHFASEAEALAWPNNPIDNLETIVKAGIPIVHVYGDADEVVPWDENTGIVVERVKALGGNIKTFLKPGCQHHPHGPVDPDSFSNWVIQNVSEQ